MPNPHKKKLIEVALPLAAINAASAREKSIRHGHPSTLHLWWARRPLAAARAVLFAQLVDDPSGYADTLLSDPKIRGLAKEELEKQLAAWQERQDAQEGDEVTIPKPTLEGCAAGLERQRLFQIIEDLVKWENSTNEAVLERARAEIRRCCGNDLPPVYDPFSGGGTIPLEAQRLGLPAYGSDLNPVAVMIGKAMIEIPPRFKDMKPIHPGIKDRSIHRNAEGLAEDVKHYGEWMRDRAFAQIGHLYPKVDLPKEYVRSMEQKQATVIAWIWARTVPSPDPAFSDVQVPLVSSFLVSSKAGREVWVEPLIDRATKTIEYRIRKGGTKSEIATAKKGTTAGKRQAFVCPISDAPITYDYIRSYGKTNGLGETLIAIVAEGAGGRVYVEPSEVHKQIAKSAKPEWRPDADLPDNTRDFKTPNYGLTTFGDLFTDRQLVALNTFSDLVHEARSQVEQDALAAGMSADETPLREGGTGAKAYAEAVSVYLAFAVNRCVDRGSSICTWDSSPKMQALRNTFSRQAIPMTWDFAEGNPFSSASGNILNNVDWVAKAVGLFVPVGQGQEQNQDAQTVIYPEQTVISTDPPYYDNIGYADLSDFFFTWMKPAIRPVYPELFGVLATPKSEELVATPYRHGGREAAEEFFMTGMSRAVANMADQSASDFPATIYYAFKQSEIDQEGISSTGWATFLQAVIKAGYAVVGTWPMRTEMANRMIASGTNALANSVVLVCRKKEPAAESVTRLGFVQALKRELPPAIAELQAANIAPADMPQSAIGPGMGIFSRYAEVLESDDTRMSVKTALQLINAELDTFLNSLTGDFDEETRFAVTWFEQFGYDKGDFGTAQTLCQARGLAVESVKHAGIIESAAGKVRLLKRDELEADWDPVTDKHLTIWECLQHLVHALNEGEDNAARMLKKIGPKHSGAIKDLAYYLYDLTGSKRQDAQEATAYNGLIALWPDLTARAATVSDDAEPQGILNLRTEP